MLKMGHNSQNNTRILLLIEPDLHFMIIYLCTKFQSNTPILSKDIPQKPFFKVENFSKLKRAVTPKIIGGFYPKSNLAYILRLYTCV